MLSLEHLCVCTRVHVCVCMCGSVFLEKLARGKQNKMMALSYLC